MRQYRIHETRFAYRTTGTGASVLTAYLIGGAAGMGWGTFVAFAFYGGEVAYDVVSNIIDELVEGAADAERALSSGTWVPGY